MKPGLRGGDESAADASPTVPLDQFSASPSSPGFSEPAATPRVPDHELLRCIGRGAYGQVWLARTVLGEYRAVKLVYRNKFEHERPYEREFEGIQKFEPISRGHDSQVDILHVGRDEQAGCFYYVMELADDGGAEGEQNVTPLNPAVSVSRTQTFSPETYVPHTLKLTLNRRKHLPVDECVQIGLALTTALEHLHGHGLLHRDIKPSNIIFMKGVPKLGDIGLVASMDATMSFVGTAGFLPPEGPGTPQGDIYSLGKVLYEMCMGRDRQEFPRLPANLTELEDSSRLLELNAIILKACHKEPGKRYRSAQEMGAELALLQRGKSVKQRRAVERRWKVAMKLSVGIAAVALLGTGLLFLAPKKRYAPNPEALQLYKEGQFQYSLLTPDAHERALEFLTQAVERDPKFVQPYAEMAALYTWLMLPGITNEQIRLEKLTAIAAKALAIDSNAAEGYIALSWCKFLKRDWRGAEDEIKRAIELNPNLAIAHGIYCAYLCLQGRAEEAKRSAQRALELEPPWSRRVTAIVASWPFQAERRLDLLAAHLQRAIKSDPGFSTFYSFLGDCYEAQSNYLAALEAFKKVDQLRGEPVDENYYSALREALNTGGEVAYLRKNIDLMLAEKAGGRGLAGYYARLGEKDKAIDEIEKHFDEPQEWHQIKFLPMYDSLTNEPRFKALVKRAGLE